MVALLLLCTWWIQIAKQIWLQAKEDKYTCNRILSITLGNVHVTQKSQIKWATPVAISLKTIGSYLYRPCRQIKEII